MTPPRFAVPLPGCRARPIAAYLKAVGLHRLVAEQVDPDASSTWEDGFTLCSTLDAAGLRAFLETRYRPTPVVSPWNGGSGFYPGDNQSGIGPISASDDPRFAPYRAAIAVGRAGVARLAGGEKAQDTKQRLVDWLRAELDDDALPWLDAAVFLGAEKLEFPPLLGTGGNDGRLDFSNNFMQRLVLLFESEPRLRRAWLDNALFDVATPKLVDAAVGQFLPAAAGGANTGFGFDGGSRVNPWDFVLLLEGALAFAAAAVRKLEGSGTAELAFPFMVRAAAAGYASASRKDEAETRNELWLPVWERAASWRELRQLFGEGRVLVGQGARRRPVATALDFARAVGELGADRGVGAFERYGFHVRNGLSTLAVPLGRWRARRNAGVDGLGVLDAWLAGFRRAAGDDRAPAAVARARRALDEALFTLCDADDAEARVRVLVALGAAEAQLVRSWRWAKEAYVGPVPWLDGRWLPTRPGPVARLAVVLAGQGLRFHAAPVERRGPGLAWADVAGPEVVWTGRSLLPDLVALARRRALVAGDEPGGGGIAVRAAAAAVAGDGPGRAGPLPGAPGASPRHAAPGAGLADVAAFLAPGFDDEGLAALARGVALVDPDDLALPAEPAPAWLPPLYAPLALAHDPRPVRGVAHPPVPGLLRRALAGDATGASRLALARLRASGVPHRAWDRRRPGARDLGLVASPAEARRVGAALAFPLSDAARDELARLFLLPDSESP